MGIFDFVRCSCPIDVAFEGLNQTTDIHTRDASMNFYWVSPQGFLHWIDYSNTADFVALKPGDVHYNHYKSELNFYWIPNGNRGKISPVFSTRKIHIQPTVWDTSKGQAPVAALRFKDGSLEEITYTY